MDDGLDARASLSGNAQARRVQPIQTGLSMSTKSHSRPTQWVARWLASACTPKRSVAWWPAETKATPLSRAKWTLYSEIAGDEDIDAERHRLFEVALRPARAPGDALDLASVRPGLRADDQGRAPQPGRQGLAPYGQGQRRGRPAVASSLSSPKRPSIDHPRRAASPALLPSSGWPSSGR